ncbi:fused MFS/spermidine synthase [Arthrobacter sp. zg-ZUI100]|uniref:spermidine synthase n=1 Tax=Arthrobacter jiangjiafuii TaxID=2817475 RepID=UPI001AED5416|nr:fused MFS/spermidine synthase [Arthrobacter jiangjiafuii]MBP3035906.1 fused MFS/spermidine synthase [Arthrobacter jiangjiafuii]
MAANKSNSGAPSRLLRGIGAHATITEDGFNPGAWVLSIGGAEQSHVNLAHPEEIFYEYLRRIGNVLDLAAPAGEPIRTLHLGAGALTLTRYLQATRPGSEQHAVELERELLDFVLTHLPLPEGTVLDTVIGDARDALSRYEPGSFDAIVLDVFSGADAPEHLTTTEFYAEAAALLSPAGVLLVNVGDDPGLAFCRRQVRNLQAGMAGIPGAGFAALAEKSMFTGRYPGNIVLAGTAFPWPEDWTAALLAAGPHPADVLTGERLDVFASGS